jgi:hypothetical protein
MKFRQPAMFTFFAIAAIVGTQSHALSQEGFKVPTHPTLSEIGTPAMPAAPSSMPKLEVSQPLSSTTVSSNQLYFSHPPTLVRSNALQKAPSTPSTYEFTITIPADAGAPLKAVTIMQDKNLETVRFNTKENKAFAGKRYAAGMEIPLASVGGQEIPGTTMVVFDQPVQPGSTVTVAVDAKSNPNWGGVYEFGVTAYPTSENGRGQFLGYGRINFHGAGD